MRTEDTEDRGSRTEESQTRVKIDTSRVISRFEILDGLNIDDFRILSEGYGEFKPG